MKIGRPLNRGVVCLCCLVLAGAFLGGCRKEEQGRILHYDKGTYLGKTDQKLDAAEVNKLRLRVSAQSGS